MCNKIEKRITCEYCGYPASESRYDKDLDQECSQEKYDIWDQGLILPGEEGYATR